MKMASINKLFSQDVQFHSLFSDGKNTITEMLETIHELGIKSCIITDHAKGWEFREGKLEFFRTIHKYEDYLKEITALKLLYNNSLKLYSGLEIEVDIHGDFQLDRGIQDYLKSTTPSKKNYGVDFILGSIHSESFEEDCIKYSIRLEDRRSTLMENIINLIKNKNVDIFAHPFQALHGQFSDNFSDKETDQILDIFMEEWSGGHKIFFEINGKRYPEYEQWVQNKYQTGELVTQDIKFLKKYKDSGGKFVLGSDAHTVDSFATLDFSIIDELKLVESDIYIF